MVVVISCSIVKLSFILVVGFVTIIDGFKVVVCLKIIGGRFVCFSIDGFFVIF